MLFAEKIKQLREKKADAAVKNRVRNLLPLWKLQRRE
jgi:hypothetical protein